MTVGELLSRISEREFQEWRTVERLDPFGNRRGDLQAGSISAVVATLFGKHDYDPSDLALTFRRNDVDARMAANKAALSSLVTRRRGEDHDERDV